MRIVNPLGMHPYYLPALSSFNFRLGLNRTIRGRDPPEGRTRSGRSCKISSLACTSGSAWNHLWNVLWCSRLQIAVMLMP